VGETLPDPNLLVQPFLRREAVLSSRIEGTQTLLSDLLVYEASNALQDPRGDAREVSNYVGALERGFELLPEIPISVRLVNELHRLLLTGTRGEEKRPGEIREKQVYIGTLGTQSINLDTFLLRLDYSGICCMTGKNSSTKRISRCRPSFNRRLCIISLRPYILMKMGTEE
jgi:hypothetical protein